MSARENILSRVRASLGRRDGDGAAARVDLRLAGHAAHTVPARGRLDLAGRVALFASEVEKVGATTVRVTGLHDVPGEVARFLASHNLPAELVATPDAAGALPWGTTALSVRAGHAEGSDAVGVSIAWAGVAETGTLVMASDSERPTTVNFLPETHVAVLPASRLVGTYEEVWTRLRALEAFPGSVNLITGPSRSADIEQTIQVGAHGPRRLHIVIVADG